MMNVLDNLVLHDNAYFYKKINSKKIPKHEYHEAFTKALLDKSSNSKKLWEVINVAFPVSNTTIYYSIYIFKYDHKPTFLNDPIKDWHETKLAYMVFLDFGNFLVISKKNVSGIQDFINKLQPLDYKVISTLLIDEDTSFEKFSLSNTNISGNSIRSKSVEANNLKESFSTLGASGYIVSNLRLNNQDEKVSVSMATSRINQFGNKNTFSEFALWSQKLVNKIENYEEKETYLSVFAEPLNYEKFKDNLIPIAILFDFSKLISDKENGVISDFYYEYDEFQKGFDIFKHIKNFERLCYIKFDGLDFKVENDLSDDLEIKLNAKSITVKSLRLRSVKILKSDGSNISILDYINQNNCYIITFENLDLIYTSRKLFRDSRLLGNIEHFLNVFRVYPQLISTTSEKGTFANNSVSFDNDSVFGFVESEFIKDSDFFICDDLGREWADHIGLYSDKVTFFHSKWKDTILSASAFQDIVGQAQKNLGNLSPSPTQLEKKVSFWKGDYPSSKIARLRNGNNINDGVDRYKLLMNNPNLKREVNLVINFISKSSLENKLIKLKNGESFKEKNEVIQILWLISSLISSCKEVGVDVYISCKP